ncbi:MAG: hypothetical protein M1428_02990 [Deltaproteobacteria bacterium]|nr:hypothetical protein [Deltaproteobacteria bacterium]
MEIKKFFFMTSCLVFLFAGNSYAGWTGPTTVLSGTWGTGTTQFGLEQGDSLDSYPKIIKLNDVGSIGVLDNVNNRIQLFDSSGNLIQIFQTNPYTFAFDSANNLYTAYKGVLEKFSSTTLQWQQTCVSGNGLINISLIGNGVVTTGYPKSIYCIYSPAGTLLTTTSTRPMVLGILSQKITGTSHYKKIEYPDGVYFYYYTGSTGYFPYDSGIIRINTNLIMDVHNGMEPARVYAFTATAIQTPAGQKQQYQLFLNTSWVAPLPQYKPVERPSHWPPNAEPPPQGVAAEYGQAVIGPDGSIYTYDRSDTNYKIVKWTWSP